MNNLYLHRLEVLKYDCSRIPSKMHNYDLTKVIDRITHGELVIVIEDENRPFVKVMSPRGKQGWVYIRPDWFVRVDDCVWSKVGL